MASCLRKLLKNTPLRRLIVSLHTQQSPSLLTPPILFNHQTHIDTKPDHHHHHHHRSPQTAENFTHFNSSVFYPSFPSGFFLDPTLLSGSIHSEPENDVSDDGSGMVYADSVKKKRKKKMNKHKYKKLRKRLRRQT